MTPEVAEQIALACAFIIGFLLWWDNPMGQPRGGQTCGIVGCRVHRKDGK